MSSATTFPDLVNQLQAGEESAALQVFERFTGQLLALARQHLGQRFRGKVDPEDVVQSVYRSFFYRVGQQQFNLPNWNGMWALLSLMTLRKCRDRVDYFLAARRDVRLEATRSEEGTDLLSLVADRSPSPDEAAVLADLVERWLASLTPEEQAVVVLCLQGWSLPEVSERVGRAHRTVRRLVARARERLLDLSTGAPLSEEIKAEVGS